MPPPPLPTIILYSVLFFVLWIGFSELLLGLFLAWCSSCARAWERTPGTGATAQRSHFFFLGTKRPGDRGLTPWLTTPYTKTIIIYARRPRFDPWLTAPTLKLVLKCTRRPRFDPWLTAPYTEISTKICQGTTVWPLDWLLSTRKLVCWGQETAAWLLDSPPPFT